MKKVLAIALTMCMTIGVVVVSLPKEEVKEVPQSKKAIETETYHTDIDFSLLYSLEEETRKEDIVDLTQSEAQLLMQVSRAEGGESLEGQLWTMRTLLNRVESDEPDFQSVNSIGEVIFQKGQFEVVSKGLYANADVNVNTHLALALCESGWNETEGALWFEAKSNSDDSWHKRNLTFVKEVAGNLYYK